MNKPREYQQKQLAQIREGLREHDSVLLQSVTGSGKGFVSAKIFQGCQNKNKRIMFMVHGLNVIDAFCEELESWKWGDDETIEYTRLQAGHNFDENKLAIVASADTLFSWYFSKRAKHSIEQMPTVDFLIADEARMLQTPSYVKIFDEFKKRGTKIIGLDATPDGKHLGKIYDTLIHGDPTTWFIDRGYLVPVVHYAPNAKDAEFVRKTDDIPVRGGEFTDKGASEVANKSRAFIGDVVKEYKRISMFEYGDLRRFVVACQDRKHALSVQSAFLEKGHKVEYIDANTPQHERNEIKAKMEKGEVLGVVSVQVMIYGANWKFLEIAILARFTRKPSVMIQYGGRVLRTFEGKEKAIFIDMGIAIREIGYLTDEYQWSLDAKEFINGTRELRNNNTETKEVDIICGGCGHVYKSAATCPRCGHQNIIAYDNPNVIYYDRELQRIEVEKEQILRLKASQADFIAKAKGYALSKRHDLTSQLTLFNKLISNKKYDDVQYYGANDFLSLPSKPDDGEAARFYTSINMRKHYGFRKYGNR